ncbi:MAG TPA: cytochrome c [Chryseosolibacter sp.]
MVIRSCLLALLALRATGMFAQPDSTRRLERGRSLFQTNCGACHGVHKEMTGPMLASITKKRSTEWLLPFIKDSQAVIVSGDEYALALFEAFNHQVMPAFPHLPDSAIRDILYYIETESTHPAEDVPEPRVNELGAGNVLRGKELFTYQCANCHSISKEDYGPALGSVTKRRSQTWLVSFIRNSQQVIRGGDAYATGLYDRFDKKEMVPMEFLGQDDIAAILEYIEFASSSSHAVAGANGRPLEVRAATRAAAQDYEWEDGGPSFKTAFIAVVLLAATLHGYLIIRLFRYLQKRS